MRRIRYWVLILLCLVLSLHATRLGFLPFTNLTAYQGNWFLDKDIPTYLERSLSKTYSILATDSIISYLKSNSLSLYPNLPDEKRRVAAHFNGDLLISGDIVKFVVSKRIVGEGKYGGLKTYEAKVHLRLKVYSKSQNAVIYDNDIRVEKKDNNTAVNIGRLSKDETLFDSLNTEKFGSKTFDNTIAGLMMREVAEKMLAVVQGLPVPVAKKGESKTFIRNAKIVDKNETDLFINAGFDDKIAPGDIFNIYSVGDTLKDPDTKEILGISEKFLGSLEISEVKASHFSRARIIEQKDSIKTMNIVRIEK